MRKRQIFSLLLVMMLLFSLAACSGGPAAPTPEQPSGGTPSTPTPPTEPTTPTEPTLTLTAASPYSTIGSMVYFTVAGTGDGFDRADVTYTITDGEGGQAIPTEEGCRLRAMKEGALTVTATSGGLSASCTVTVFPSQSTISALDDMIYYLGRNETKNETVHLNNTAAGFEITFYGQSISAKLQNDSGRSVFAVFVDDETDPEAHKIDLTTDQKNGQILLASFEEPGVHTLRVQKITEEQISHASFSSLSIVKGGLLPHNPQYDLKIEVYGDSITAGYGNMRAESEADDQSKQNGLLTYAGIAAARLNAEYRTFCQSGIGLYTNPYNVTRWMKDTYANVSPASNTPWDMRSYTPDIVIINVGTNDIWATNGSTGNAPFSDAAYIENYIAFVQELHAIYGEETTFILCSGMMETGLASPISSVVTALREAGIDHVYQAKLPLRSGYGGHPCQAAHRAAADVLLQAIENATGITAP